ncbi:MAG: putative zinc-binding protein [Thermacetogeniaceae bacterium]
MSEKVVVVPCSGIGKVFGLLCREAALKVVTELCPEDAETVCLAYLVTGDEEAKKRIEGKSCITVDGCAKMCAAKNVKLAGGIVKEEFKAVDAMRAHRGVNAGTATRLTEDGWKIAGEFAENIAEAVRKLRGEAN